MNKVVPNPELHLFIGRIFLLAATIELFLLTIDFNFRLRSLMLESF